MISGYIKKRDVALTSDDLRICQEVLEAVKTEFQLSDNDDEVARSAAIIIEIYRQGVHSSEHLKPLVFAARGKMDDQ